MQKGRNFVTYMWTQKSKNGRSSQFSATSNWQTLSCFRNPTNDKMQEDRFFLLPYPTEHINDFRYPIEEWYGLSLMLERINSDDKTLAKHKGQVTNISLSNKEVDNLMEFFAKDKEIAKYFPLSLSGQDTSDKNGNHEDEGIDETYGLESSFSINFIDPRLQSLMKHNFRMSKNATNSGSLPLPELIRTDTQQALMMGWVEQENDADNAEECSIDTDELVISDVAFKEKAKFKSIKYLEQDLVNKRKKEKKQSNKRKILDDDDDDNEDGNDQRNESTKPKRLKKQLITKKLNPFEI